MSQNHTSCVLISLANRGYDRPHLTDNLSVSLDEDMVEKRRLERFDLSVPAKIRPVVSGRKRNVIHLLTSDVCAGGAFFHTDQPLPEGTEVRIELVLSLEKLRQLMKEDSCHAHIKVTGRVLRSESKGMAVCFDKDYEIRPYRATGSAGH